MSTKANIVIEQGATFSLDITLRDAFDEALDVTGFTGRGQMRRSYDSINAVSFAVTLTTGNLNLSLPAANTAAIVAGRYVYDVELISNNNVSRVLEGIVNVKPEATKT
jgi:hypothetical protein